MSELSEYKYHMIHCNLAYKNHYWETDIVCGEKQKKNTAPDRNGTDIHRLPGINANFLDK